MKDETKTKTLPLLERFETHKTGKRVPVYRLHKVKVDEKGQPDWSAK